MATPFDPKTVLKLDPWLEPFIAPIGHRHEHFRRWKDIIAEHEGGYESFTRGYEKLGFNVKSDNSVVYREWAPGAREATLIGDFSASVLLCASYRFVDTDGSGR